MKKNKKPQGIERLKSKYGLMFISPWIVGLLLFFILPIITSLYYSFCKVELDASGIVSDFSGFKNFGYILNTHPFYTKNLTESLTEIAYSLPAIFVISLVLALMLNQKFGGRTFFRALYFLPVIVASGVVVDLLFAVNTDAMASGGANQELSSNMIDFTEIIKNLGLPDKISEYISLIMDNIFDMVWHSGIQIILFISGLQSIPDLLYEVAEVEGCSKWESFWFITFPMLSRVTLLVIVFTIVELLTDKSNVVMQLVITTLSNLEYGVGAAMAWLYFIVIGLCLSLVMFLLDRFWLRRWR